MCSEHTSSSEDSEMSLQLACVGLERFSKKLHSLGVDTLVDVEILEDQELEELGMALVDIHKLHMTRRLISVGLERFIKPLVDIGAKTLADLSGMTDMQLESLGLKLVHRRKIRQLAFGTSPPNKKEEKSEQSGHLAGRSDVQSANRSNAEDARRLQSQADSCVASKSRDHVGNALQSSIAENVTQRYLDMSYPERQSSQKQDDGLSNASPMMQWPTLNTNKPARLDVEADPFTPAFVCVSDLSVGWRGKRPNSGYNTAVDTATHAPEALGLAPPPGFEQEDASRGKHEKRQEIILCIKQKAIYKEYAAILERGEPLPCEVPGTPDPADEGISKRKWESLVSKWRAALRQVSQLRHGVCDETADPPFDSPQ